MVSEKDLPIILFTIILILLSLAASYLQWKYHDQNKSQTDAEYKDNQRSYFEFLDWWGWQ